MKHYKKALGIIEPDIIGEYLKTGYCRFRSPIGINGLAREQGPLLEILAVVANKPGTGQFRTFIERCKQEYETVTVWEDWNPIVGEALKRYGFVPTSAPDGDSTISGWIWRKCKHCQTAMIPGDTGNENGSTMSRMGPASMVKVWKCPQCGYSAAVERRPDNGGKET